MIVDIRTYDIVPRKMQAYLNLFEEYAMPVLRQYIGEPIGYFVVEHGPLNQVVHLWGYDSLADVEEKRQEMRDHYYAERDLPDSQKTLLKG